MESKSVSTPRTQPTSAKKRQGSTHYHSHSTNISCESTPESFTLETKLVVLNYLGLTDKPVGPYQEASGHRNVKSVKSDNHLRKKRSKSLDSETGTPEPESPIDVADAGASGTSTEDSRYISGSLSPLSHVRERIALESQALGSPSFDSPLVPQASSSAKDVQDENFVGTHKTGEEEESTSQVHAQSLTTKPPGQTSGQDAHLTTAASSKSLSYAEQDSARDEHYYSPMQMSFVPPLKTEEKLSEENVVADHEMIVEDGSASPEEGAGVEITSYSGHLMHKDKEADSHSLRSDHAIDSVAWGEESPLYSPAGDDDDEEEGEEEGKQHRVSVWEKKPVDRSHLSLTIPNLQQFSKEPEVDPQTRSESAPICSGTAPSLLREEVNKEFTHYQEDLFKVLHERKADFIHAGTPIYTPTSPQSQVARKLGAIAEFEEARCQEAVNSAVKEILSRPREDVNYEVFQAVYQHAQDRGAVGWSQVAWILHFSRAVALGLINRKESHLGQLIDFTVRLIEDKAAGFIIKEGGWSAVSQLDLDSDASSIESSNSNPLSPNAVATSEHPLGLQNLPHLPRISESSNPGDLSDIERSPVTIISPKRKYIDDDGNLIPTITEGDDEERVSVVMRRNSQGGVGMTTIVTERVTSSSSEESLEDQEYSYQDSLDVALTRGKAIAWWTLVTGLAAVAVIFLPKVWKGGV